MRLLKDFQPEWEDLCGDIPKALKTIGENGWYTLGTERREFRAEPTGCWDLANAPGVASRLDAIEMSARLPGCGLGDRVPTSLVSDLATTVSILRFGAVPVFTGCGSFGLINSDADRGLLMANPNVRLGAVIYTCGNCQDLDRPAALRDDFGLSIVEHCALSSGICRDSRQAGSAGHLAATSFYPTTNLRGSGDGSAIPTDREGWNSRQYQPQAAILRGVLLPRLDERILLRCKVTKRYFQAVDRLAVQPLGASDSSQNCWPLFPVRADAEPKIEFIAHPQSCKTSVAEHFSQ